MKKSQIPMKKSQIAVEKNTSSHGKMLQIPMMVMCFFFPTPNFFSSTPALFTARKKPLKIARVSLLKTIE